MRPRVRLGRVLVVGAVTLFVALLVYGLIAKAPSEGIDERLAAGMPAPAPALELPVLEGSPPPPESIGAPARAAFADGRVSLAELRGTPVVLNFWASWCPPCRTEQPLLERVWREQRERDARAGGGLLFLGLDMQDLSGDARAFLQELGGSYPVVRDRGDEVARRFGVTGLPETFFIDARGRIVGHVIGAVTAEQLATGIAAARSGRVLGTRAGGAQRSVR